MIIQLFPWRAEVERFNFVLKILLYALLVGTTLLLIYCSSLYIQLTKELCDICYEVGMKTKIKFRETFGTMILGVKSHPTTHFFSAFVDQITSTMNRSPLTRSFEMNSILTVSLSS